MAKSLGIQSELAAGPEPGARLGRGDLARHDRGDGCDRGRQPNRSSPTRSARSRAASRRRSIPGRTPSSKAGLEPQRLVQLLEGVVTDGTGRRRSSAERRAAGKTGTTQDYRDAWFVGFTSNIVVGVWVGNDDNSPMDGVVGGDIPAKIWHDFVEEAEPICPPPSPRPRLAGEPQAASGTRGRAGAERRPSCEACRQLPIRRPSFSRGRRATAGRRRRKGRARARTGALYPRPRGRLRGSGTRQRQYRCDIDNIDIAEAVVLNGAGRAAANAPGRLQDRRTKGAGRRPRHLARVAGQAMLAARLR